MHNEHHDREDRMKDECDAARERAEEASEGPTIEPQGQSARSSLATGSLPVLSADLKNENSALRAIIGDLLEAHETVDKNDRWACVEQAAARAYAKLEELDRHAASTTPAPAASNKVISP